MLISGIRRDLQDNNNYINKYGKITHVCPTCGSIYINDIKLSIECSMLCASQCARSNYSIETPVIYKTCNCGSSTIQVDNLMGLIFKTLIDKGYSVDNCCEGHCFVKDYVPYFDFPFIKINGNIKPLIPSAYNKTLSIELDFDKTVISCKEIDTNDCPCVSLETFNEYKIEILETMHNLVKSLPDCPFNKETTNSNICNRGSCNCGQIS